MVIYSELDEIFGALADPTRRKIIERLARGQATVGELAEGFEISQPAISKHIKVLERSKLLSRRVVGRVHHCRLQPKGMTAAAKWFEKQERFWNEAFDRLDAYFEKTSVRKK